MDSHKRKYFEDNSFCCNPYNKHNDSKNTNLRHLTDYNLQQLNYGPFTKKMKICDTCRKSLRPDNPSRYHSQSAGAAAIEPFAIEQPEPIDIDEVTVEQPIANRVAHLQAEERITNTFLSQSSSASSAAPVNEIPSTESLQEVIRCENYDTIKRIAEVVGVNKPTLADVRDKNYESYLRFEAEMVRKTRNLFGYASVSTELDQVITNIKDHISTMGTERDKVPFLDLLPNWNKSQIRRTFDNVVTEHTINLMERFKPATATNQSVRKPGNQPIHNSTVEKIIKFYNQDDITRPFPGMKDVISIKTDKGRVKMQKRLLLGTLEDLHKKYIVEIERESSKLNV